MSHNKLRTETNCLNCDAQVDGRYCKNCGQENVEPKHSFSHLVTHFLQDITHLDGKFFNSMKLLLTKPGFLSTEYLLGRRMKYLDPIRMYLSVSFVFFVLYLFFNKPNDHIHYEDDPVAMHAIDTGRAGSLARNNLGLKGKEINGKQVYWITFSDEHRHGLKYYDSVQKSKPDSIKLSFIGAYFDRKLVSVSRAYNNDPYGFIENVYGNFLQSISKIFFFSLPIFSFILFLFYIRRRKDYYYVSHAIFALHIYSVGWFFFALRKIIMASLDAFNIDELSLIDWLIYPGLLAYVYIAMLRFYKQGWFKTFIKFLIVVMLMLIVTLLIFLGLLANSFFIMGSH